MKIDKMVEKIKNKKLILDAGCGDGLLLSKISDCKPIFGIDRNEESLKLAKTKVSTPLVRGDIINMPFKNETFNGVILADVIEHVENDFLLIKEIHRVLRRKGRLIITTPLKRKDGKLQDRYHFREYSVHELCQLVNKLFGVIETEILTAELPVYRSFVKKVIDIIYKLRLENILLYKSGVYKKSISSLNYNPKEKKFYHKVKNLIIKRREVSKIFLIAQRNDNYQPKPF